MKKALKIYFLVNCLSLLFLVYVLILMFNTGEVRIMMRGYFFGTMLAYLIVANGLNAYAKKIGKGLNNPARTVKRAKYFGYAALVFFLAGIALGLYVNRQFIYIALAAIPLDIIKIYMAFTDKNERDETELLDDFEIE